MTVGVTTVSATAFNRWKVTYDDMNYCLPATHRLPETYVAQDYRRAIYPLGANVGLLVSTEVKVQQADNNPVRTAAATHQVLSEQEQVAQSAGVSYAATQHGTQQPTPRSQRARADPRKHRGGRSDRGSRPAGSSVQNSSNSSTNSRGSRPDLKWTSDMRLCVNHGRDPLCGDGRHLDRDCPAKRSTGRAFASHATDTICEPENCDQSDAIMELLEANESENVPPICDDFSTQSRTCLSQGFTAAQETFSDHSWDVLERPVQAPDTLIHNTDDGRVKPASADQLLTAALLTHTHEGPHFIARTLCVQAVGFELKSSNDDDDFFTLCDIASPPRYQRHCSIAPSKPRKPLRAIAMSHANHLENSRRRLDPAASSATDKYGGFEVAASDGEEQSSFSSEPTVPGGQSIRSPTTLPPDVTTDDSFHPGSLEDIPGRRPRPDLHTDGISGYDPARYTPYKPDRIDLSSTASPTDSAPASPIEASELLGVLDNGTPEPNGQKTYREASDAWLQGFASEGIPRDMDATADRHYLAATMADINMRRNLCEASMRDQLAHPLCDFSHLQMPPAAPMTAVYMSQLKPSDADRSHDDNASVRSRGSATSHAISD